MKNSYYTYVEENKLLIECFLGETDFEDILELRKEIEPKLNGIEKLNILIDIQNSTSKVSLDKVQHFISNYPNSEFTSKIVRIAVVTAKPNQVVKTMLFIDGLKKLNIPVKTFSSISAAVVWLDTGIEIDKVKLILEDFKKSIRV